MSRKSQLSSIKSIAKAREEDAARILAQTLDRKSQAEQRLVDLVGYREDYESRLKLSYSQNGAYIEQLREGRAFVEKLSEAIRLQQQQIHGIAQELDRQLNSWRSTHASHKALSSLLERYRKEAARVSERRMDAETEDAFNSRYAARLR